MIIRDVREGDLGRLVALWSEVRQGSYGFSPCAEGRLTEELQGATSVLLAEDERGGLLGFGFLHREFYGEELQLVVRPGPGWRDVAERLLSAVEPRAQTEELTVVVDVEEADLAAFFLEHGYARKGSLYQMLIDMESPRRVPPVPPGYRLRSLRAEEEAQFVRLVNVAYEGERLQPGTLARWQTETPDFSAGWVQVAEFEGRLVAAVVARTDREFEFCSGVKRGYLGPAATLPDHQGRGLAKALTVRALNFLWERGMRAASLYTWSGNRAAVRVVNSVGFRLANEWHILTKSLAAG